MKFKKGYIYFIGILFFIVASSFAFHVKSGFEALKVLDYFKAKNNFYKGLKYQPSASAFGLASIYSRNDNPFYHKDSAFRYIVLADSTFETSKKRKKEKWSKYGWTRNGIDSLRQIISTQFYVAAKNESTVAGYTEFISSHSLALECAQATNTRDSLAFLKVVFENTSEAYDNFIAQYPTSKYIVLAEDNFYYSQYLESTQNDSLEQYFVFLRENPKSPMKSAAEQRIYKIVTAPNTEKAYKEFVSNYSENSFNEQGWKEYFQVYLGDYSKERIKSFIEENPTADQMEDIRREFKLADSLFLPVSIEGKYGYMNRFGEVVIAPNYQFAGHFVNGLAVVGHDEKYGAINKMGKLIIPFDYASVSDFIQGRAIVEVDEKLGIIDRNNKIILPFEYEDLGDLSSELIYFSKGLRYGYADIYGVTKIAENFDEAYSFSNGRAMVEIFDYQAMIDVKGNYIFQPVFEGLSQLTDSLYSFEKDELKGMLSISGKVISEAKYDNIGLFRDGLAFVINEDTLQYINNKGEIVISRGFETYPNFELKGEFKNGSAVVSKKEKYGRINTKGEVIIPIDYDNLGVGRNYIPYKKKDAWGLINASNKMLIPAKYESIDMIEDRFVVAGLNDSIGLLDLNGNNLLPFTFHAIEGLIGDYIIVEKDGHRGLYKKNKQILEIIYNQIRLFKDDLVTLVQDDQIIYYDLRDERIVELKNDHE